MRSRWRWALVAVLTAALALLPAALARLPVGPSTISADELLARIRASGPVAFSGYAEATGSLSLPVGTGRFSSLNDLFGATTDMRVWWRGSDDYRVDTIGPLGEIDLHHDAAGDWTWDYESNTGTHVAALSTPVLRLPRADDLVPAALARRLLAQATAAQVTRLPAARIAGQDAAGLRLATGDPRSTIDHVDIWASASSGLALRVRVYARGAGTPVVETAMLDVATSLPAASTTAFDPAPGVGLRSEDAADIVAAIERFGHGQPPTQLAGLPARTDIALGPVGVYGQGLTLMVAVPLPGHVANSLASQLSGVLGVLNSPSGLGYGVGPIGLLLSPPAEDGDRWLIAGTVTAATLRTAAGQLPPVQGFGFGR